MSSLATSSGSLNTSIATARSPRTVKANTANGRLAVKGDDAGGAVDQRRANVGREPPGAHRPSRDPRGAVQLERIAVAAVSAQHDVWVEHRHQRLEVALPGGGEVRVDDRALAGQVRVRTAAPPRARAGERGWRAGGSPRASGRPSPRSPRMARRTCRAARTRAARPGPASRARPAARSRPQSASNASCSGSVPAAGFSIIGSGRKPSSGCSPRVRRERSTFRQIRATTVVSHRSRLSICSASVRAQPQPRLLHGVLGLAERAEHPVGDRAQLGPQAVEPVGQLEFVHRCHTFRGLAGHTR